MDWLMNNASPLGMAMTGAGILGNAATMWGDYGDDYYDIDKNLNKDGEAYKQYQRLSNLDSDFYKIGNENIRRTMSDMAPKSNDFLSLAGATGGSAYQALRASKQAQTNVNEQAGNALNNLQLQGIQAALNPLQMAYGNAQSKVNRKYENRDMKMSFFDNIANMGSGLMGASIMKSGSKSSDFINGLEGRMKGYETSEFDFFKNPSENLFNNFSNYSKSKLGNLSGKNSSMFGNFPSYYK